MPPLRLQVGDSPIRGVYLASDEAACVHGTVIDVDGGRVGVAVIAG